MTDFGGTSSLDVLAGLGTEDRKALARVRVFYHSPAGREPTVSYRAAGDLFGISHLAEGGRRITSTQAVEPSVIWAIANSDLVEVARRLPAPGIRDHKGARIAPPRCQVLVESVATWPVRLRVANFLLASRDSQERQGTVVKQGWTHETIADLLACTGQTGHRGAQRVRACRMDPCPTQTDPPPRSSRPPPPTGGRVRWAATRSRSEATSPQEIARSTAGVRLPSRLLACVVGLSYRRHTASPLGR